MERIFTEIPITKTICERCGKTTMISFGPMNIDVRFLFFKKVVKAELVYCPNCGYNKFKINIF